MASRLRRQQPKPQRPRCDPRSSRSIVLFLSLSRLSIEQLLKSEDQDEDADADTDTDAVVEEVANAPTPRCDGVREGRVVFN